MKYSIPTIIHNKFQQINAWFVQAGIFCLTIITCPEKMDLTGQCVLERIEMSWKNMVPTEPGNWEKALNLHFLSRSEKALNYDDFT